MAQLGNGFVSKALGLVVQSDLCSKMVNIRQWARLVVLKTSSRLAKSFETAKSFEETWQEAQADLAKLRLVGNKVASPPYIFALLCLYRIIQIRRPAPPY